MTMFIPFFRLRADNKSFLGAALSEESKIKRRRTKTVNVQMTLISWCLEFTTGIWAMLLTHFSVTDELAVASIFLADACLNFIVIPGSYLFNNEATKQHIIAEGWRKWFNHFFRSHRVAPAENDGQVEAPIALNPMPRPIPTISGNIKALSVQK